MKKIHMEGELTGDFYRAEEVDQLINEIKQLERENADLKIIAMAENRTAIIDWCEDYRAFINWLTEHHEEILKEYTGFMEAGK